MNMTKKQYNLMNVLIILMSIVLLFELVRDSFKTGDFIGYAQAGNLVLNGSDIYSDYLNTWPPFFSVFSVVLAWADNINPIAIRFIWLLASILSILHTVKLTVELFLNKEISWKKGQIGIPIQEPILVIPFLILMRYTMDNLANIQINIFMLLASLLCIRFFVRKKYIWLGLILGFTISLKIYTIFLLLYFVYKREYKVVFWTFLSILICTGITLMAFGVEQGIQFYKTWATEVAPGAFGASHKNQSVFGALLRFFTDLDPSHNMYVNFTSLPVKAVQKATYVLVAIASIYPAYLFRNRIKSPQSFSNLLQYSIVFTAIPLLSPVSWKAYFIFLWVPYFLIYLFIYRLKSDISKQGIVKLKVMFWLSLVLNVFTTELLTGPYFSDLLEAWSTITFGSILLIVIQVVLFKNLNRFDLDNIQFKSRPI